MKDDDINQISDQNSIENLPDMWEQKAVKMLTDISGSSFGFDNDTKSRVNLKAVTLLECAMQLRRALYGV